MKLSQVIKCLKDSGEMDVFTNDPEIRGIEMDSRKVRKGSLLLRLKAFRQMDIILLDKLLKMGRLPWWVKKPLN